MQTTAGSLALVGVKPPRDAFLVAKLREAGAVILGQDQPLGVGQHPLDAIDVGLARRAGSRAIPTRSIATPRLELGLRGVDCGEPRGRRGRTETDGRSLLPRPSTTWSASSPPWGW